MSTVADLLMYYKHFFSHLEAAAGVTQAAGNDEWNEMSHLQQWQGMLNYRIITTHSEQEKDTLKSGLHAWGWGSVLREDQVSFIGLHLQQMPVLCIWMHAH